jgi:pSer/pThr/pTyr-binding forkhead associated (FHA) protein
LVFVDLGSKRGSKVNHHVCNGRKMLKDGDLIKVGRTRMRVFGTSAPSWSHRVFLS